MLRLQIFQRCHGINTEHGWSGRPTYKQVEDKSMTAAGVPGAP